jgi:hypothetical protein
MLRTTLIQILNNEYNLKQSGDFDFSVAKIEVRSVSAMLRHFKIKGIVAEFSKAYGDDVTTYHISQYVPQVEE